MADHFIDLLHNIQFIKILRSNARFAESHPANQPHQPDRDLQVPSSPRRNYHEHRKRLGITRYKSPLALKKSLSFDQEKSLLFNDLRSRKTYTNDFYKKGTESARQSRRGGRRRATPSCCGRYWNTTANYSPSA
jgi:hypothetical protein